MKIDQLSIFQKILKLLAQWAGLIAEQQTPTPPVVVPPVPVLEPQNALLTTFCLAIKEKEGYFKGSRSFRNCNPGNFKFSPIGYASKYGDVKKDKDNFAIFPTYELGWLYLTTWVKQRCKKYPNQTIFQFVSAYAPSSDGNSPHEYADFIAKKLGVDSEYKIGGLVV